jgi:hypothetical protein
MSVWVRSVLPLINHGMTADAAATSIATGAPNSITAAKVMTKEGGMIGHSLTEGWKNAAKCRSMGGCAAAKAAPRAADLWRRP